MKLTAKVRQLDKKKTATAKGSNEDKKAIKMLTANNERLKKENQALVSKKRKRSQRVLTEKQKDAVINDYFKGEGKQLLEKHQSSLVMSKRLLYDVTVTTNNQRQSDRTPDGCGLVSDRFLRKGTILEDDTSLWKSGSIPSNPYQQSRAIRYKSGHFAEL